MAWIATVSLFSAKYDWPHVLLVNDLYGQRDSVWSFWFIEAIVQISVVLALWFAVPRVSRFERRQPLAMAYAALVRRLVRTIRPRSVSGCPCRRVAPRTLLVVCPRMVGFACADRPGTASWSRWFALASLPGYFADDTAGLSCSAAIASDYVVADVPTCPDAWSGSMTPLAGASLYIYLTHLQLHSVLEAQLRLRSGHRRFARLRHRGVAGRRNWSERVLVDAQSRFGRVTRTKKATGMHAHEQAAPALVAPRFRRATLSSPRTPRSAACRAQTDATGGGW